MCLLYLEMNVYLAQAIQAAPQCILGFPIECDTLLIIGTEDSVKSGYCVSKNRWSSIYCIFLHKTGTERL